MLHDIRKQYDFSELNEGDVSPNPFEQFRKWLNEALLSPQIEPTAMVLSTVDASHMPHSRIVLLKDFTDDGFVFYTNYEGHKAQQMEGNNCVSLLFFWPSVERQVRVTGRVRKVDEQIATSYFCTRPLDSRIGAWSSPQSTVIPNRQFLYDRVKYYQQKYGNNVPKPPHWGGYIVDPDSFEFWQGRPDRLHDRLCFEKHNTVWKISRLAP